MPMSGGRRGIKAIIGSLRRDRSRISSTARAAIFCCISLATVLGAVVYTQMPLIQSASDGAATNSHQEDSKRTIVLSSAIPASNNPAVAVHEMAADASPGPIAKPSEAAQALFTSVPAVNSTTSPLSVAPLEASNTLRIRLVSARPAPAIEQHDPRPSPMQAALSAALSHELSSFAGDSNVTSSATTERPAIAPDASSATASEEISVHRVVVQRGESLYLIFKRLGLSQADLLTIAGRKGAVSSLRRLQPGQKLDIHASAAGRVSTLIHHVSTRLRTVVTRNDGKFVARIERGQQAEQQATEKVADTGSAGHATVRTPKSTVELAQPLDASVPRAARPTGLVTSAARKVSITKAERTLERKLIPITSGDSMYSLFLSRKVPTQDLAMLLQSGESARALQSIRPGQSLEVFLDENQSVAKLLYHQDQALTLEFTRKSDGGFVPRQVERSLERVRSAAVGKIESSLFLAGQRAGLSDNTIMELVEIFGWDIDFALEVRVGDSFTVIYEELYLDGKKVRDGDILAAEFVNRGRSVQALRYADADGFTRYYTPDGLSMRKAFLRTPVEFTRISSRFSSGRRHPVLHKIRAHKGVDYAAPRGTPVKASGDGKVVHAGRKGGYGKTVILRHGSTYSTLYAHLNRIAKRVRSGRQVQQGQVIGYIGSTGLSTGPHLHYEFRVRGNHRDPLNVKLPKAQPIRPKYKRDFLARTGSILAQLKTLSATQVAGTRKP